MASSLIAGPARLLLRGLGRLRSRPRPPGAVSPGDRVLVARADHLGDLLMALPAVESLAESVGRGVDVLVKPAYAALLAGAPGVGDVVPAPFPWHDPDRRGARVGALLELTRELRDRRYRAVVELTGDPRTQALLAALGAPIVLGRNGPATRLLGISGLVTRAEHQVDRGLEAARSLGGAPVRARPRLLVPPSRLAAARARLDAVGAGRIVIHPGAAGTAKGWAPASFAALAQALAAGGERPVFVVGPGEESLLDPAAGFPALTGLDLTELAAVLAAAGCFVGNDSGPGHLAAAVGARVVSIFGPTRAERTAPRGAWVRVVAKELHCRPCWEPGTRFHCPTSRECLGELPVEPVLAGVREALGSG